MSPFTEEQRRRAEENRLKALERRAQSQKSLPAITTTVTQTVPQAQARPTMPIQSGFSSQSRFTAENNVKTNAPPKNRYAPWNAKNGATASSSATSSAPMCSVPIATGTCRLMTRDRFVADMGYHAEVVKMFKNIPGSKYGKFWSKL